MAERLWVLAAVAVFSGWHWSQMERPRISAVELALLALLAVAPALLAALGRLRAAIAALVVAAGAAVWLAFGYLPFERGHPVYLVRIEQAVHDGARSWFDMVTPFDPGRFPLADGLVQVCFFGLMALFAWLLLDGRHALASVGAAFALFAIPSTAVTLDKDAFRAALFLLLALAILAVCQRRVPIGGTALGQLAGADRGHAGGGAGDRLGAGRGQGRLLRLAALEPAGRRGQASQRRLRVGTRTTGRCTSPRSRPRCSRCSRHGRCTGRPRS